MSKVSRLSYHPRHGEESLDGSLVALNMECPILGPSRDLLSTGLSTNLVVCNIRLGTTTLQGSCGD
jgi:hypothetical protein